MSRHRITLFALLLAVPVLAVALSAVAADDELDPFSGFDTRGESAVVLELVRGDHAFAKVLIREHNMGAVDLGAGGAVGIVPEDISLRGDSARLGLYRLDRYQDLDGKGGRWIEDLELVQGELVAVPSKTEQAVGTPGFQIRLLSVRLAER